MSLKAKIEAVIYASEEPVTLAQLAGLLGEEVQAELDAAASAQQSLPMQGNGEADDAAAANDEVTHEAEDSYVAEPTSETIHEVLDSDAPTAAHAADEVAARKVAKEADRKLREHLRTQVDALIAEYASDDRGIELREVAGGYRLSTKPEYHDAVRGFIKSLKPPMKLTLQALETLAVVAYKQPVTSAEISEIRGVDTGGVLGGLMTRKLVTTAGRKQVIGRPILYKTTKDFLLRFGLKDINELPSIEEFEKMAGELADQEELPMEDTQEGVKREREAIEPQPDGSGDTADNLPATDPVPGTPKIPDSTEVPAAKPDPVGEAGG